MDVQSFEEEVVCPISLGPPVAPQITPCGHVFSFPAIIQHLVQNPALSGMYVCTRSQYLAGPRSLRHACVQRMM